LCRPQDCADVLADRPAGPGVSGAQGRHNPSVSLAAHGRMISTRRAKSGTADRRVRHGKRTRTPCLYGLPASRNADLHQPGAGDVVAARSLSRPSSPLDDELGLCRPNSGGSLIWQANQAQVGTTTRSAQSAITRAETVPQPEGLRARPSTRTSPNSDLILVVSFEARSSDGARRRSAYDDSVASRSDYSRHHVRVIGTSSVSGAAARRIALSVMGGAQESPIYGVVITGTMGPSTVRGVPQVLVGPAPVY